MMILYVRTGCPFCAKVKAVIADLGIADKVEEKNIDNPEVAKELLETGGKQQVPYLVDTENGKAMYESDDISNYLREHYSN